MFVSVTIEGLTPLIMNRFTGDNEADVSGGHRPVLQGDKGTPREQAQRKLYSDKNGALYIPGANLYAAIIDAGKFHKAGKSKITTNKTSLIPAGVMITEIICLIDCKGWEVDSRSVVIPSTGGRIMCHRPRVDAWKIPFTLEIDDRVFSPQLVRAILDDAGSKVGLGDYRPSRKGPFGRFKVVRWHVETAVAEKKKAA